MWASSVLISNPVGQVVINTLKNYPLCHLYLTKEGKNSIFASDRLSSGRFGYLPKSGYRLQKKNYVHIRSFLKIWWLDVFSINRMMGVIRPDMGDTENCHVGTYLGVLASMYRGTAM